MKFLTEENWNLERDAFSPADLKDNLELFKFFGGDMKTLFQKSLQNLQLINLRKYF